MDLNALTIAIAGVIVCALYLMRRRARLQKED